MDITLYLFAIALFIAVVLSIEAAYLAWQKRSSPEARRLARRLESIATSDHTGGAPDSILKQRLLSESPGLQELLVRAPGVESIERLLVQSGVRFTVAKFSFLTALCAIGGALVAWGKLHSVTWALIAAIGVGALPLLYVRRARAKRLQKLEQQLPDALDFIGRALRAGHAFSNALQMAGNELPQPIGGEFRLMSDKVSYGTAVSDALISLADRVPSLDVKYVVIAVLIHRESGGNLAEMLDNLSTIIRARLKLLGTIRVLSAEGRLSAWILGLLPFGTAFMVHLVNPGFMSLLWTDPAGKTVSYVMAVLMLCGFMWMRKIVRIRV
jgi:tight adherence protein B